MILALLIAAPAAPVSLSLKQLSIAVPAVETPDSRARIERFGKATAAIASCTAAERVAADQGAAVIDNEAVPFATLPPPLQARLATLPVGHATPMFGTPESGEVRVLVVCARR